MDDKIKNNFSDKMNKNNDKSVFKQSDSQQKLDPILNQDQVGNGSPSKQPTEPNNQNPATDTLEKIQPHSSQNMDSISKKDFEDLQKKSFDPKNTDQTGKQLLQKNPKLQTNENEIHKMPSQSQREPVDEKIIVSLDGQELQIRDIYVQIKHSINEHARATITAMIDAHVYDEYVKMTNSSSNVTIRHTIKGAVSLLYEGILTSISSRAEDAKNDLGVYHLEIHALSHTAQLDVKKINRSFQDITMIYDDLIAEVIEPYDGVDCIINAPKGVQQEVFVLQYMDTDWEFLQREISKFEEGLFADVTLPAPKFHIGTPEGISRGALEEYDYTISKRLNYFSEREQNAYESGINEFDFMHYEIFDAYATDTFRLGDQASYQGITLYISSVFSEIKDFKLYNTYKLTTKNGMKRPRLVNGDIQGLSLPGKVIDVQENLLKLHLEIDEEQPVETAYWFDYAAFYATWYCMPELEDMVNLHLPTLDETDAIGLNSFKQNPDGGYKRNNQPAIPPNTSVAGKPGPIDFEKSAKDPDVKILTTIAGRMIQLGPDNITIQYDDGTFIVLHDSDGIVLETDKDISLHATGKIHAYAQDNIEFEADTKITIRNQASSIELDPSSIIIRSADTRMN